MSNIEDLPRGPGRDPGPPDSIPPVSDPDDPLATPDDIREPSDPNPPVEPDPEEGNRTVPGDIERG